MQDFKKLQVWGKSHNLTLKMYALTCQFPREEIYGLTSQIRRACTRFQLILLRAVEEVVLLTSRVFFR